MKIRITVTFLLSVLILLCSNVSGYSASTQEVISIEDARDVQHGQEVTITGWITVADELGGPSYLQDETGGIAVFPGTSDLAIGDSVVVTGSRTDFNGLEQISAGEDDFSVYPEGHNIVNPETVTVSEFSSDDYQGELISIQDLSFTDSGTFSGETNYEIYDQTGSGVLRIDGDSELPGTSIPSEATTITGVGGHFRGEPQLLPRNVQDLGSQIVTSQPYESDAGPNSITFSWETIDEGTSGVRIGETPGEYTLSEVTADGETTEHTLTVDGLDPATIYHAQLFNEVDGTEYTSGNVVATTTSPEEATQDINVYFNGSVNEDLATGETAVGNYNFADHYLDRIEQAEESIDITFYNLSQNVGSEVTDALIQAYRSRGVQVRVVMDADLSNPANANRQELENNGIPVIQSDPHGDRDRGIMHNKFAIIDYHGGDPEDIWLIVSSWNTTDAGTYDQYQNMIEFQDPAIAGGYLTEFEQMWGGSGNQPDDSEARFGQEKNVVNPTAYWIDDTYIEVYFSPQIAVENRILGLMDDAQHDINVNTMGISRWNYRNRLEARYDDGIETRGAIGDIRIADDLSEDIFNEMQGFGDFHDHGANSSTLLHHKAAIFDGIDQSYGNGKVLTGSMNWTASGNFNNDENTMIIRDTDIANLYMQEFSARYTEAGGQDDFTITSSEDLVAEAPEQFELNQNYPNPFNPVTTIAFELPQSKSVTLKVFDVLGRNVATLIDDQQLQSGSHTVDFDGGSLSSGTYIYRVELGSGQQVSRTMTLVK